MEAGREPRVRAEVAVYRVRTDPPNSRRNGVIGLWKRFTQKSATSVDDSRIEGDLMSPGKGTVLSPALHTARDASSDSVLTTHAAQRPRIARGISTAIEHSRGSKS